MSFTIDAATTRYTLEKHIEAEAQLYKGLDGRVYAKFQWVDGTEIVSVDSRRFEDWLVRHCIDSGHPVIKSAIKLAISSIKARKWTQLEPVCVRVGVRSPNSEIYLDFSNGTDRAVQITAAGWSIVDHPKVLFPTDQNREALEEPEKEGSIHNLREMFGLSVENEALIVSFCLACLRGAGPFPVLLIAGPDTCGKTALARYLRALLDPSNSSLRNLPKNQDELAIFARNNYLLAYDDVRTMPLWFGAAICKLSKGTTFSGYRNGREQILFDGARPVILVGDDEMLQNPELISRALVVRLDRRSKFASGVGREFKDLAKMRGALLDIVSHGLGRWDGLDIPDPIRDYEFEKWIAACELPRWGLGGFRSAYEANVSDGQVDLVELDPFLMAFRDYMTKVKAFRGTAGQLLQELNATGSIAKGNRWPRNPRALSGRLRRDAKLLSEIEIEFDIKEGRNRDRLIAAQSKLSPELPLGEDETSMGAPECFAASRRSKAAPKTAAAPELPYLTGG